MRWRIPEPLTTTATSSAPSGHLPLKGKPFLGRGLRRGQASALPNSFGSCVLLSGRRPLRTTIHPCILVGPDALIGPLWHPYKSFWCARSAHPPPHPPLRGTFPSRGRLWVIGRGRPLRNDKHQFNLPTGKSCRASVGCAAVFVRFTYWFFSRCPSSRHP